MKKSKHIISSTVKIVSKIVYLIIRATFALIGFFIAGAYLSFTARETINHIKLFGLKDGITYAAESLIAFAILAIIGAVLCYAARTAYKLIKTLSA